MNMVNPVIVTHILINRNKLLEAIPFNAVKLLKPSV